MRCVRAEGFELQEKGAEKPPGELIDIINVGFPFASPGTDQGQRITSGTVHVVGGRNRAADGLEILIYNKSGEERLIASQPEDALQPIVP